jgi:hypothetical protein
MDITMLIIYNTRKGLQREKEVLSSQLIGEIRKLQSRGCWSIKVL